VDLNSIWKLTFNNPEDIAQGELWINVSATAPTTLNVIINGVSNTVNVGTAWDIKRIYSDDFKSSNEIIFQLATASGNKIYIKNATTNSNMTIYKYVALSGWVEQSDGLAIDFLFSDFLMKREIEKYSIDDHMTITAGNDNSWALSFYPTKYSTDSYISYNIIIRNSAGRYLDNFTAIYQIQTPRDVIIISNIDDIDATVWAGEDNSLVIIFENTGTADATIETMTVSISWMEIDGYQDQPLNPGTPVNITITTNSDLDADHVENYYVMTVTMTTTNNGTFSDWIYIYVDGRGILTVTPSTRHVDRIIAETNVESFIVTNNGIVSGDYRVVITYTGSELLHNSLSVSSESFTLDAGEAKTLEFTVSGFFVTANDSWNITIEEDNVVRASMTFTASTTTDSTYSWLYMLLGWIAAPLLLYASTCIKKDKNGIRVKKRMIAKLIIVALAFAAFLLPIYYWSLGEAQAPWKPYTYLKDQVKGLNG